MTILQYTLMDTNKYFVCECIYHRKGCILCDVCSTWVDKTDETVKEHRSCEPVVNTRWKKRRSLNSLNDVQHNKN